MTQTFNRTDLEEIIPEFPPIYIGRGAQGTVYQISQDLAAKFSNSHTPKLDLLINEFEIAQELYDLGVSVPRPKGIFSVHNPVNTFSHSGPTPAFVMEYLPDAMHINLESLDYSSYSRAKDLWKKESQKVKNFNFKQRDHMDFQNNALYVPKRDKVYLIDFVDWDIR